LLKPFYRCMKAGFSQERLVRGLGIDRANTAAL
jgi:hypothetical protein